MTDFKITNKKTNTVQFMNGTELANFIFRNDRKKYIIEDLTQTKRKRLDNIIFNALGVLIMLGLYFGLCEILHAINLIN
jgi:hypothetical protein